VAVWFQVASRPRVAPHPFQRRVQSHPAKGVPVQGFYVEAMAAGRHPTIVNDQPSRFEIIAVKA
jgi:hypothetical protein